MQLFFVLILFLTLWLTFGMIALARRASRPVDLENATMDELRARIRTLEAIVTDQDRQLRRDFDGLA